MKIFDLRRIVLHITSIGDSPYVDGCDVLERIVDVPGFVSLLHHFKREGRMGDVSFVEDNPDPIRIILGGDITFSIVEFGDVSISDRVCISDSVYVYSYRNWV
jgi:hypothetical protein